MPATLRLSLLVMLLTGATLSAQEFTPQNIKQTIKDFKNDPRGPYLRIRWFCEDGTVREPKDPCPEGIDGIQHASYKELTENLADRNNLYFGEILAAADNTKFWDAASDHSRLKQYQLGNYLKSVDNGWILEKAQYYRGAIQSEDEEAWGIAFFNWLLKDDKRLEANYYLIRQALKDIPHAGDDNIAQRMRSESKVIAEEFPKFMDVRVKIHGQPDVSDVALVQNFREEYDDELTPELKTEFKNLLETLTEYYAPINLEKLNAQVSGIKSDLDVKNQVIAFTTKFDNNTPAYSIIPEISDMLCNIRTQITQIQRAQDRLTLLDVSLKLEEMLLKKSGDWEPETLKELLDKVYHLSYATAGTGLLEVWEWEEIEGIIAPINYTNVSLAELNTIHNTSRSAVQWSAAMAKATYDDVVEKYTAFEPLATGFIDDRVRSSVALPLGKTVSELGDFINNKSNLENDVMDIADQSAIHGLNPGYAMGELVVVPGNPDGIEVSNNKIYIFKRPPSDLKPVAGIATVDEGNLVSHVQLLARNLGIPNAALIDSNLEDLEAYNGKTVFYAVSNKGTVIIKPADNMSAEEKDLFSVTERNSEKIAVPIEKIRLDKKSILNMRDIDASASGILAGPKAANLGQLKKMFPEQVVEGLVIPFGIFKDHMDLPMPGQNKSYWEFLTEMFASAEAMRNNGTAEAQVEDFQFKKLATLRDAINRMQLKPQFISELRSSFSSIFGKPMGQAPVFLRSDTNMEDLKEFTGAGLNLTLFNVVEEQKIVDGIKKVWASPYTERSFKWRQVYLSNPENVFPSILVIPSVDVAYSGVMITKGINEGTDDDLTVAFSRGAGGAVDGQAAETRLITASGNRLLAPARQPDYIRLPESGGTKAYSTTFESTILSEQNIQSLREVAQEIRTKIPQETHTNPDGAYDVELGFQDDKIWLFQIRPFVENKNALSNGYLDSISPRSNPDEYIEMDTKL
ncbi:PEP/pyruvate-binding domain-containing protein [Leeuwenhoekiella marinoflava]|uniref:Phosphoenolpyruvate synthase n=2 Tax=Leeuwenhoekiella marinoflava TaxID=988 RepID=A0A4Q0PQS5_9FLAO|nr:PEP/pyruvate-binding domain-containing protein [Leeuwenhoekiella marinoflava]RXG32897.1 pyruvate phosphate dikinase-like enzyme [Leeuwenhoekiella marinoflava]SHE60808.1 Pyruvate phosphate dikinase, PEP/pyruvate binding domain [Leeuwenhoekiella marinoflava DSM 3653]